MSERTKRIIRVVLGLVLGFYAAWIFAYIAGSTVGWLFVNEWALGVAPAQAAEARTLLPYTVETGGGWGVPRAVNLWNANGEVRLVRVETCAGSEVRCLTIRERGFDRAEIGLTSERVGGRPVVELNTGWRDAPRSWRVQASCHEIGHALGLEHHPGSCMDRFVDGRHTTPNRADLEQVRQNFRG